jgi:hypothetical protein
MLLLTLFACASDLAEPPSETGRSGPVVFTHKTVTSAVLGDGFGASLAWGKKLLVGAPRGPVGKVYSIENGEQVLYFEEPAQGAAGTSIAWDATETALIGAPLSEKGLGTLYRDDEAIKTGGKVLGARIQATVQGILISESKGFWQDESFVSLENRVGDLAFWGDTAVAGHPFGPFVLSTQPEKTQRLAALDEAGTALCVANFDSDPEAEIAIGAPGSGKVHILNQGQSLSEALVIGTGDGRFGQSLACRDHFLVVGAPMAGEDLSGAVWCFEGPASEWALESAFQQGQPWQQLGAAVEISPLGIAMGAPGTDLVSGSVRVVSAQTD